MNNIELATSGLKCDNPKCDWEDLTIKVEDWEKHINARCPKCGQNILTEKDYENAKILLAMADLINVMTPEQLKKLSEGADQEAIAKGNSVFKDTVGMELLNSPNEKEAVILSFETHNEIKCASIRKADDFPT